MAEGTLTDRPRGVPAEAGGCRWLGMAMPRDGDLFTHPPRAKQNDVYGWRYCLYCTDLARRRTTG